MIYIFFDNINEHQQHSFMLYIITPTFICLSLITLSLGQFLIMTNTNYILTNIAHTQLLPYFAYSLINLSLFMFTN